MKDIPSERYAGHVEAAAIYHPAGVGALRWLPAYTLGIAHRAAAAGGPNVAQSQAREPSAQGGMVPFRRATTFRTQQIITTGPTAVTAAQQPIEVPIDGSGYVNGIDLDVSAPIASGNAATVVFQEDGPYAAIASVVFKDVTGELINLDGYSLRLANLYGGYRRANEEASTDTAVWQKVAGAGGTGGSFRFHLYVPITNNIRDLLGTLGNQSREQRYYLRSDVAPSTSIYSTAPTALPSYTIARNYESFTVPGSENALGLKQEQVPPKFGVLHFLTKSLSPSAPQGSATVQHYLARLGNTIRYWILVVRSNGSRATAETNAPTKISLYIGDIPVFGMSPAEIRTQMWNRYGFDAPSGVYVFDAISDFHPPFMGGELGEDYFWTKGLNQAFFEIVYPSGMGSTNNSLTIITDDLQVPSSVDIYN